MEVCNDQRLDVAGDAGLVDEYAFEGSCVEVSAGFVAGARVDLDWIFEEFGVALDVSGAEFELLAGLDQPFVGGRSLEMDFAQSGADAFLGYRAVRREVEKPLLLLVQLGQLRGVALVEFTSVRLGVLKSFLDGLADHGQELRLQLQGAVVVGHLPLDVFDGQVGQVALAVESRSTLEVLIGPAVPLGLGVDQAGFAPPLVAAAAVEETLEVVVQHPVADAGL